MPLFRWLMCSGAPSVPTDPSFASVIGLLHMDALPLVDYSSYGYTFTGAATQSITSSGVLYGANSWNGPGAGSVLQPPSAADSNWNIGTNAYTFECAFKSSSTSTKYLIGWYSGIGVNIQIQINASGVAKDILFYTPTGAHGATSSINFNDGAWHYFAVSRGGGTLEFYIDGTRFGGAQSSVNAVDLRRCCLGCLDSKGSPITMLDEVRMTRGVKRYTGASYSVQTEAFPDAGP
jgi:hypothetical protein